MENQCLNTKSKQSDTSQTLVTVEVSITCVNPDSGSAYEHNCTLPVFTAKGGSKHIATEIKKNGRMNLHRREVHIHEKLKTW